MFALPPAARQPGREEQPAGPTPDAPSARLRHPRSLSSRTATALVLHHYCNEVFIIQI